MESKKITFDVATKTILKIAMILLLLIFLYLIREIILIAFIAIVIVAAMNPAVKRLKRLRVPKTISVLSIYILTLGLFISLVTLIVPPVTHQISDFAKNFPDYTQNISDFFSRLQEGSAFGSVSVAFKNVVVSLSEQAGTLAGNLIETTFNFFGGLIAFIVVLVLAFYMSLEEDGARKFIRDIIPKPYEDDVLRIVNAIENKLGRWIRGQLILGLSIATMIFIGLSLLGIKYALTLALVAGILEFIPVIGPLVSAVPALILALAVSPTQAFWVLLLYIIIQQVENHILVPKIMGKAVGLSPAIIVVSLLIGAKLFGVLGVVLAVPIASGISVFTKDFFEGKKEEKSASS